MYTGYIPISQQHMDGLAQGCSISSALAMEIPQSGPKPSVWRITSILCVLYNEFSPATLLHPFLI